MEKGDLILTPAGLWHEHGNEGTGPVVWLDALDLPVVHGMEASYAIEGPPQAAGNAADASQSRYRRAGLVPYASLDRPRARYPLLRYPWREVREALAALAAEAPRDEPVRLAYVNPETGEECLPTLGVSALLLRPGETVRPARCSASAAIHVVEGRGHGRIEDVDIDWEQGETFVVPTHAGVEVANGSPSEPSFLFVVDDAPLQRKLGFYEVFPDDEKP